MPSIGKMIRTLSIAELHAINRMAVLELIRHDEPISRTEIARQLEISVPTAMRIVDGLVSEGLVRPANSKEWSGGRKRELYEYNGEAHLVIGVDLGGTKIYGAVANLRGEILYEAHDPNHQSQSEESLMVLCNMIADLERFAHTTGLPILGIGVGVPGITDAETGLVIKAPSLDWEHFPLKARLSERFNYPLVIENDVNLAALGEYWFGLTSGFINMVLIAIGTGIGAGIILNGAVLSGAHQTAGEVGYLLPDLASLHQKYPGFGAFEQRASGTGIAARARQRLDGQWDADRLAALTAEDIFTFVRLREPWAQEVLDETVDYLAQAIAAISLIVDPEVIILGGGVARSADLLIEPILNRLDGTIPVRPKIVASQLGYRAGILGSVARLLRATSSYYHVQKYT